MHERFSPVPANELRDYLGELVTRYEHPAFIADDPIAFPHAFDDPRDQEVIGLFAALLAWGRRATILNKLAELAERMDFKPYAFVRGFNPARDVERLASFRHRTFRPDDAVALMKALQAVLYDYGSLEKLFTATLPENAGNIGPAIQGFSDTLLSIVSETPQRMRKHLPRPSSGSACKRLALYARWMVRQGPVDLGLWTSVSPRPTRFAAGCAYQPAGSGAGPSGTETGRLEGHARTHGTMPGTVRKRSGTVRFCTLRARRVRRKKDSSRGLNGMLGLEGCSLESCRFQA